MVKISEGNSDGDSSCCSDETFTSSHSSSSSSDEEPEFSQEEIIAALGDGVIATPTCDRMQICFDNVELMQDVLHDCEETMTSGMKKKLLKGMNTISETIDEIEKALAVYEYGVDTQVIEILRLPIQEVVNIMRLVLDAEFKLRLCIGGLVPADISPDALVAELYSLEDDFFTAAASRPHLKSEYSKLVNKAEVLRWKYKRYSKILLDVITDHILPLCVRAIRALTTGPEKLRKGRQICAIGHRMWRMMYAWPPFSVRGLRDKTAMFTTQLSALLDEKYPVTVLDLQALVALTIPICLCMRVREMLMECDERVFNSLLQYGENTKLVYEAVQRRFGLRDWADEFEKADLEEIFEVEKQSGSPEYEDEEGPLGPQNTPEGTPEKSSTKTSSPEVVTPKKSSKGSRKKKNKSSMPNNGTPVPTTKEKLQDSTLPDQTETTGADENIKPIPKTQDEATTSTADPITPTKKESSGKKKKGKKKKH